MSNLNWTEILSKAGLETPGYEEAVAATNAFQVEKRAKAEAEREAKSKKRGKGRKVS